MTIPFDNPLFLIPVSTGLIFIIAAIFMLVFPPKEINALYGYRSANSMKSKERWDFAQKYATAMMIKLGGLLALSGTLGCFYIPNGKTAMFMGLGLMIVMVLGLLFSVEKAIKKKFNNTK